MTLAEITGSGLLWWAGAVIGGCCLAYGTGLRETVQTLLRLTLISLPVILLFSVPAAAILAVSGLSDEVRAALVGAMVVVAGWLVTFLFQELARSQDQKDLVLALMAEISIIYRELKDHDTQSYLAELEAIFAKDPDYRPFVTTPYDPSVFNALASQIARLPSQVVDPVVQFYALLSDLKVFADDLRSDGFARLPSARAQSAYLDYYETRRELERKAETALDRLKQADVQQKGFLRSGHKRRNQDGDQSDRALDAENSEASP